MDVEELALTLIFEEGETLRFESEVGPYESGQICRFQGSTLSEESAGTLIVF